jgi:hypothetical protein
MATQSSDSGPSCQFRPYHHAHRWRVVVAAGLGAGFGMVVNTALIDMANWTSEQRLEFVLTTVIMMLLAWVLIDPFVGQLSGQPAAEAAAPRPGFLRWLGPIVGLLLALVDEIVHTALTSYGAPYSLGMIVVSALIAGTATYCWLIGAQRSPPEAAKLGGASAAGASAGLVILLGILTGQADVILAALLGAITWGLPGFFGGLAIDRGWGGCPTIGILRTLIALGAAWAIVALLFVPEDFLAQILVGGGWALGLLLYPAADSLLLGRRPIPPEQP